MLLALILVKTFSPLCIHNNCIVFFFGKPTALTVTGTPALRNYHKHVKLLKWITSCCLTIDEELEFVLLKGNKFVKCLLTTNYNVRTVLYTTEERSRDICVITGVIVMLKHTQSLQ